MPELPEVETVARGLRDGLTGAVIAGVRCHYPPIVTGGPRAFARRVAGRRIDAIARHGKYLFLVLDRDGMIVIHLRMTGQLTLVPAAAVPSPRLRDPHVHLEVLLAGDAGRLVFRDVRKFGRLQWVPGRDPPAFARGRGLGADALALPLAELEGICRRTARALKALLLDQTRLAGVGNIYADEILFRCRLSPLRPARGLSPGEVAALHRTLGEVLRESIARQGTTISDFVGARGEPGGFQHSLRVYGREGEGCPGCGRPIRRERVAGRSTYHCPACQPVDPGDPPTVD